MTRSGAATLVMVAAWLGCPGFAAAEPVTIQCDGTLRWETPDPGNSSISMFNPRTRVRAEPNGLAPMTVLVTYDLATAVVEIEPGLNQHHEHPIEATSSENIVFEDVDRRKTAAPGELPLLRTYVEYDRRHSTLHKHVEAYSPKTVDAPSLIQNFEGHCEPHRLIPFFDATTSIDTLIVDINHLEDGFARETKQGRLSFYLEKGPGGYICTGGWLQPDGDLKNIYPAPDFPKSCFQPAAVEILLFPGGGFTDEAVYFFSCRQSASFCMARPGVAATGDARFFFPVSRLGQAHRLQELWNAASKAVAGKP